MTEMDDVMLDLLDPGTSGSGASNVSRFWPDIGKVADEVLWTGGIGSCESRAGRELWLFPKEGNLLQKEVLCFSGVDVRRQCRTPGMDGIWICGKENRTPAGVSCGVLPNISKNLSIACFRQSALV